MFFAPVLYMYIKVLPLQLLWWCRILVSPVKSEDKKPAAWVEKDEGGDNQEEEDPKPNILKNQVVNFLKSKMQLISNARLLLSYHLKQHHHVDKEGGCKEGINEIEEQPGHH